MMKTISKQSLNAYITCNIINVYIPTLSGKREAFVSSLSFYHKLFEFTHLSLHLLKISWGNRQLKKLKCVLKKKKKELVFNGLKYFSHGTRCAGEVSAARDNNVCGVGVAYDSKVAGMSHHSKVFLFPLSLIMDNNFFS